MLYIRSHYMSSVNDNPNRFMVLDAISRGMKLVGKLAKVTRLDMVLVAMMINDLAAPPGNCREESLIRCQEGEKQMTNHKIGTREEWLAARLELLKAEKALTRRSDELAQWRQKLPWGRIDKD